MNELVVLDLAGQRQQPENSLDNMMNIFEFVGSAIRTIVRHGEVWFVANDVADVLGYVDQKQAVRDHCKCSKLLKGVDSLLLTSSPRGITIIPERDVYRLIMRSKLPSAERFEEWVVSEVIPSIRKSGSYSVQPQHQIPQTYAEALMLAATNAMEVERLELENQTSGSNRIPRTHGEAADVTIKQSEQSSEMGKYGLLRQMNALCWDR